MLTGLAVSVAFRAGVLNIGAEGQFLAGAAGAAIAAAAASGVGNHFVGAAIVILAGTACGAAWGAIAAVLKRRSSVPEVLSTLMLNFVALEGVGYLVHGPLQEPTHLYPQSAELAAAFRLPRIVPGQRLHLGFAIAIAVALVIWWVMRGTAAGFRVRATGANPHAARSAGMIDVERVALLALIASGALAGLAGAVELTGVTFALYENISPGYGYTAIGVALLADLNPLAVMASAIFFGALDAGGAAMQRDAAVPAALVSVIEAGIVLTVLAVKARGLRGTLAGADA